MAPSWSSLAPPSLLGPSLLTPSLLVLSQSSLPLSLSSFLSSHGCLTLLAMFRGLLSSLIWTLPDAPDCSLPHVYNKELLNHTLQWPYRHYTCMLYALPSWTRQNPSSQPTAESSPFFLPSRKNWPGTPRLIGKKPLLLLPPSQGNFVQRPGDLLGL